MKKWIVWFIVILILGLASIYIFIPPKNVITIMSSAEATITGEFRYMSQEENWEKWWLDADGKHHVKGEPFTYGGNQFRLNRRSYNAVGIDIIQNGATTPSFLNMISYVIDSTGAVWACETPATLNPVTRVRNYLKALRMKRNMTGVMKVFSDFISNPKNVYGMTIYKTTVHDTLMVSSRFTSPLYPTTAQLYGYFDTLKQTITKQRALPVGFPIMNLRKMPDGSFETQTGMPTNRLLKNDGKILALRMPPGLFMTADIRGGAYTVDEAMRQLELFIQEYNRVKIATGFQILITDRRKEPDTTKWITKIKIPIVP
ncbi:MAG TPA: GyrI-like domain-containing protein [Puia sp.]